MIETPVRYDPKQLVIRHGEFGTVLCQFSTGLIFKDKDRDEVERQIGETANEIVTAINDRR